MGFPMVFPLVYHRVVMGRVMYHRAKKGAHWLTTFSSRVATIGDPHESWSLKNSQPFPNPLSTSTNHNWPSSTITHHQPSTINHQPSTIIHHSSFIIHHSSFIIHHSSFIIHHSSFIIHQSSFIIHHSSFIIHHSSSSSSSFTIHHSSFIIHHSSFIIHHSSFIIHHSSFIIHLHHHHHSPFIIHHSSFIIIIIVIMYYHILSSPRVTASDTRPVMKSARSTGNMKRVHSWSITKEITFRRSVVGSFPTGKRSHGKTFPR